MEASQGKGSKSSKFKAFLVLVMVIVAAVAAYYYISTPHAPPQFSMTVNPPYFHAAAGGGFVLFIQVARVAGFTGDVNVTLLNPPNWITAPTLVLNSTRINGTLAVPLGKDAPKGTYQFDVVGIAQGSATQSMTVSLKVVGVKPLRGPNGSALVYDTTKTLDAPTLAALVSVVNNTFQFSTSTPLLNGLEPGDVIAASFNQTALMPHGFLRTVLSVSNPSGAVFVHTRVAGILEAAEQVWIGSAAGSAASTGTSVASVGSGPENAIDACNALTVCKSLYSNTLEPLGAKPGQSLCPGVSGCDSNFYVSLTVQLSIGGGGHISWGGVDWFAAGLFGHEEFIANIKGSALQQFTWSSDNIATLKSQDFPIVPPIINFHIELDLAGRSFGTLLENVNSGIDQQFDVVLALVDNANSAPSALQQYCSGNGWQPCAAAPLSLSLNPKTFGAPYNPGSSCTAGPKDSGGDCARVEIGPKLKIGVNGNAFDVAQVSGGGDGEVDVFWELDNQKNAPVWSLYLGVTGYLGVYASAGFDPCFGIAGGCYVSLVNFNPSWSLGDFTRTDVTDAGNLPPPTPVVVILNTADTLDFSTLGILPPGPINGWGAIMSAEPEGESVTCIWMSKEAGQLGTSTATGNSGLACPGPAWTSLPVGQIISQGLTTITVYVVAEDSGGAKSDPSNAVTVRITLPTPQLLIEQPQNSTTVTEGTPFYPIGLASMATVLSTTNPSGTINFCQSEPQNLVWFVGGNFEADIVDVGEGAWVGAIASGTTCNPTITIPSSGQTSPYQTTIYFVFETVDPQTGNQYIPETVDGNPVASNIAVAVVNVQPTTAPPTGVTTTSVYIPNVQITSPGSGSSYAVGHSVPLQGTVSGGTPPYATATWKAHGPGGDYTIATGPASSTLNYQWAFGPSAGCTALGIYNSGTADLTLSVTDSASQTGTSSAVTITLNCAVIQTIQPMPFPALVGLLAVLFAVIADRGTVLQKRIWLRFSCSCKPQV